MTVKNIPYTSLSKIYYNYIVLINYPCNLKIKYRCNVQNIFKPCEYIFKINADIIL